MKKKFIDNNLFMVPYFIKPRTYILGKKFNNCIEDIKKINLDMDDLYISDINFIEKLDYNELLMRLTISNKNGRLYTIKIGFSSFTEFNFIVSKRILSESGIYTDYVYYSSRLGINGYIEDKSKEFGYSPRIFSASTDKVADNFADEDADIIDKVLSKIFKDKSFKDTMNESLDQFNKISEVISGISKRLYTKFDDIIKDSIYYKGIDVLEGFRDSKYYIRSYGNVYIHELVKTVKLNGDDRLELIVTKTFRLNEDNTIKETELKSYLHYRSSEYAGTALVMNSFIDNTHDGETEIMIGDFNSLTLDEIYDILIFIRDNGDYIVEKMITGKDKTK